MTFRVSPPPPSKRRSGCSPKRPESLGDVSAMIKSSRDAGNVPQTMLPARSTLPYIPSLANDQLQQTRTLIPPLPRNYHVHHTGTLQPIGPPHGSCEGYSLGTNPSFLLPSALVLNKRNTFSVDHCLLNRPKVNQRTYNLLTKIKDIQKGQGSFPDPVAGAPYPFLQRVSELSSLEGETARQEKLVRMSKNRKQES